MAKFVAVLIVLVVAIFVLMSGGVSVDFPSLDLFGNVERARIEADAAVRVAELQSQASIEVARTWADILPWALMIIGAIILLAIVLWWRGQIALEQVRRQPAMLLPGDPGFVPALRRLARRHNAQIEMNNGRYYVVAADNSYEVKALPAVRNG